MEPNSLFSSLKRLKPGVKKEIHILFTAFLWTCVGIGLFTKGVYYLCDVDKVIVCILIGIVFGTVKALFILDRVAKKILFRISQFRDSTCLGAVYSIKTWGLVLCMIMLGVILRNSSLPHYLIGTLYVTIGWALSFSSRQGWCMWFSCRHN